MRVSLGNDALVHKIRAVGNWVTTVTKRGGNIAVVLCCTTTEISRGAVAVYTRGKVDARCGNFGGNRSNYGGYRGGTTDRSPPWSSG